jgi:hypothetical protein
MVALAQMLSSGYCKKVNAILFFLGASVSGSSADAHEVKRALRVRTLKHTYVRKQAERTWLILDRSNLAIPPTQGKLGRVGPLYFDLLAHSQLKRW